MNKDYIIIDARPLEAFKDKTFSNYKKKDVINTLFKNIELGKIEESCHWITECIISGYCEEIMQKLLIYSSKMIHINNPRLPIFLWRRYQCFKNSFNHIDKKNKDQLIHLRNTQSIRNLFFDIILTILKSSREINLVQTKIKNDDLQYHNIQNKLKATMKILPSNIIRFTDPDEFNIIMNEFLFHLKNINGGYNDACYWVNWIYHWEKINKKNKKKIEIETREINNVNPKYCNDTVWLLWEVIFEETNKRDNNIKNIIQHIYLLFADDYTPGKKKSRIFYIYHAIACLTLKINHNVKIRKDKNLLIQTQCNINIIFKNKKSNEIINYTHPAKLIKNKEKTNISSEINKYKSDILYNF